ncbi:MAG TPA: hypothetical protein VGR00_07880, partial [Thermoanaerobaculia bacterium]|nr:hypothetical protein [Thermoanaerobaculia bacterium]
MTSPLASASRLLLLSIPLAAASAPLAAGEARRVQVSSDFAATVQDGKVTVEARPIEGENPIEFAKRVAADDATAQKVLSLPGGLTRERFVSLNYAGLSSESKKAAVKALFPSDVRATAGWIHIAVEDEPLEAIATWFTGSADAVSALAKENGIGAGTVSRGTTVRIPTEYLLPPFRDAEPIPDVEPPRLEFGEDEKGRFAIYRLRKKEALYSAVVVRFTGRLHAEDVIQAALKIAIRS